MTPAVARDSGSSASGRKIHEAGAGLCPGFCIDPLSLAKRFPGPGAPGAAFRAVRPAHQFAIPGLRVRRIAAEKLNRTVVFIDNFRNDGEPQSHAGLLRGDKRIEDLFAKLRWNSRPGIEHSHFDAAPLASFARPNRNAQPAPGLAHGVVGILHQIDEDLLGEIFVQRHRRQFVFVAPLDLDRRAVPIRSHRPQRAIDDLGKRAGRSSR